MRENETRLHETFVREDVRTVVPGRGQIGRGVGSRRTTPASTSPRTSNGNVVELRHVERLEVLAARPILQL